MNYNSTILNNLSLEEKLTVIQTYSLQPFYQELADTLSKKCGRKKVRLVDFRNGQYASDSENFENECLNQKHLENIALIYKVLAEWYYRAITCRLVDKIEIQEKIEEIKDILRIDQFTSTLSFIQTFIRNSSKQLSKGILQSMSFANKSLDLSEIARYVLQELGLSEQQIKADYRIGYDQDWSRENIQGEELVSNSREENFEIGELDNYNRSEVNALPVSDSPGNRPCNRIITSDEEALRYLKPLEEYVLMRENLRALGLIAQIEAVFLKQVDQ